MFAVQADNLLVLAERCEQATGPDRGLDGLIVVAVHPELAGTLRMAAPMHRYTASLDAAMTLAPENVRPDRLLRAAIEHCAGVLCWMTPGAFCEHFPKRLPAFVCAAALRARAA